MDTITLILTILLIATIVGMLILIVLLFREGYKNEKKRKKFAASIKVGDKCMIHKESPFETEIIQIDGDIITLSLKYHRECIYPCEEIKKQKI
jgi:preprotein translocase subunit YajC